MELPGGEALLHFIWRYRLYASVPLITTTGQSLTVMKAGAYNTDSGPDFKEARIEMDGVQLAGHIEMHQRRSDWRRHGHHNDLAYRNVILHVVWEDDLPDAEAPLQVAVLCLKDVVNPHRLNALQEWMQHRADLACSGRLSRLGLSAGAAHWLEMLGREKGREKVALILNRLEQNKGDWEETAWQTLCVALGSPLNKHGFEVLSQRLRWRQWLRIRSGGLLAESIFFGLSGLLPEQPEPGYEQILSVEWQFAQHKYGLEQMPSVLWQFHRTRPGNFPTLRLAQLAALAGTTHSIHQWLLAPHWSALESLPSVKPDTYWTTHYRFSKPGKIHHAGWSAGTIKNLMLNVVVPYQMARSVWGEEIRAPLEPARLPPEVNRITRLFAQEHIVPTNALASQGLLQLFKQYCEPRRCMECLFGLQLSGKLVSQEGLPNAGNKSRKKR